MSESTAELPLDADGAAGPATVHPLVEDSGNQRVLTEWLSDHESYRLADGDGPVVGSGCDLVIVDQAGFQNHVEELREAKAATDPVLLPVLLLVSEWDTDLVRRDAGEIADNVFHGSVDELVSTPIRQIELEWRMQALLRLRAQSQRLRDRQEQLRLFRRAAEAAGHAIYITDSNGVIEYVNPAFEEMTGYRREEAIGETPAILNADEMSPEYFEQLWETVSAGDVWEEDVISQRKDGERYIANQTVAPISDDGTVTAFAAVQTDITDRRDVERRLERHRDIVQRLDDPIILQDRDGNFELLNEAVAEYAGLSVEELRGTDEFSFMDEETAARIERRKAQVLETEEPVGYSVSPTFEQSGQRATFSTTRYPYYGPDGDLVGTIAICRDVTDLADRTRQLQVIDTVLRHNLRNSLTKIRLLADQIAVEGDEKTAATARRIVDSARQLHATGEKSRAITSVLADPPERRPIDIAAVTRQIIDEVAADHPDARVELDAPDRALAEVTVQIDTALDELVRNAIEHSDSDTPTVDVDITVGEDVDVRVVDNGPGISEMDRTVLEEGAATDELYHGSGLGLWLVYWIVDRANGRVEVADGEPRGTEVTVIVPRAERDGHDGTELG